jgi:hypothetical protein
MSAKPRLTLPAALALLVLCPLALSAEPRAEESPAELRESLRRSTVRAIELEIEAYRLKLQAAMAGTGPEENKAKFQKTIAKLEAERERFDRMQPGAYPDPETSAPVAASVLDEATAWGPMLPAELREAVVGVTKPYEMGSLLEVEGASRSGPFFHLAGIVGGDTGILKSGRRHRIVTYLVYRREYFGLIGDYYVYVAVVRE